MSVEGETVSVLETVPGGKELREWYARFPDYGAPFLGDAEVVALHLNRKEQSKLVIEVERRSEKLRITFILGQWIDVHLDGFSHQNVLGGLVLRRTGEREVQGWELGVGLVPGDIEIELQPCFGANGLIRANLLAITMQVD